MFVKNIVSWAVRVSDQKAELVGVDAEGNEYKLQNKVYVNGEYHDVQTDIVCTDAKSLSEPSCNCGENEKCPRCEIN